MSSTQSCRRANPWNLTFRSPLHRYDIIEKKIEADVVDERKHQAHDSLVQYVQEYFLHRFGIRKLAMKKLTSFISCTEMWAATDRRAEMFAVLLGLIRTETYSRHVSDAFFRLIRCAVCKSPGDVAELKDDLSSIKGVRACRDIGTYSLD